MEIYLDNSATTRCYKEVADLVYKLMLEDYGNPSSMHQKGVDAEKYLRKAQEQIAGVMRVKPKEIYFTSGGTESNNWALFGTASAKKRAGKRIITTAIEHSAIAEPAGRLEAMGYDVVRLPVDGEGYVSMDALAESLTPDTILVTVMMVNNEIGTVEPVAEIGKMVHEKCPKAYFHVDAIQSFGKFRIYPKRMNIDMLSVSSHKIHDPKGSGFLYLDENVERMYRLKAHLADGLKQLGQVTVHGPADVRKGAPNILNASFIGVRSEVLLHTLEDRGIYVSAGSACSSHHRAPSATLTAVHATAAEIESSVRFSFSELTTEEEVDTALAVLNEVIPKLRKFVRS